MTFNKSKETHYQQLTLQAGNAVTVPVVEAIGERLIKE